ncbi:MAG: hypothetical protein RLZZ214_2922 [Verrucomicrobiota bacterium]|jgi:hypothetical protein
MKNWVCRLLCVVACFSSARLDAEIISWSSAADKINLDGTGMAMDAGFHFELGVFSGGFVPTGMNVDQWSSHWVVADATSYNVTTRRFSDLFTVANNNTPFVAGATAWIFGYRITSTGTERILFRRTDWTWPSPDPMNPIPTEWNAKDADMVVLGSVNASGSPFLMKSARQQNFAQWQTETLTGEPLNSPGDDPDKDGASNLLEFVFGTPPKTAGAPVITPISRVGGTLQIAIPRRLDHPALLTVEVSGDLTNWASGPAHTEVVADDASGLHVRDLTPLDSAHPKRFMRLKAEPAAP